MGRDMEASGDTRDSRSVDGWHNHPAVQRIRAALTTASPNWIAAGLALLAIAVYILSNPDRSNFYNHFVWQAAAWLEGRSAIAYPVTGQFSNDYFHDVYPLPDNPGYALIPFPPLPAILLLPFVAVFGLGTDAALIAAVLGGLNVGLCWRMLVRVTPRGDVALLATVFYGFGTVAWHAAMNGSTWMLAHVAASTFVILAITVALDTDGAERWSRRARLLAGFIEPRQFAAGLLLGIGTLARLPVAFGAPFLMLVGGGGGTLRRTLSAGLGGVIPVALLVVYNVVATGHIFHPGYEHLYRTEYRPHPELYHAEWAIEDPRYIPQNVQIMLLWPPETPLLDSPECEGVDVGLLGLLTDRECPLLRPDPLGMSLVLTSPAYLLALPALFASARRRLVVGATLAVLAIAVVDLMHFSQGWVQFGYRFSNDFAPFAMILVALGIARVGAGPLAIALVAASILISAWGVYWSI